MVSVAVIRFPGPHGEVGGTTGMFLDGVDRTVDAIQVEAVSLSDGKTFFFCGWAMGGARFENGRRK